MSQSSSIFDNETFFLNYRELRERDDNHNVLIEQPAMAALIPDLEGKSVLDLGCGCGENCIDFVRRGARRVLGIDLSQKMLEVAKTQAGDPKIEYRHMDMCDLDSLTESFDMVYSSLAFHYIEDFSALVTAIYNHLTPGGILLFSQEHPLNTADGYFNRNENGKPCSYTVFDYNIPGKRRVNWFVDGVEKFHRPMGHILSTLAHAGFIMEEVIEPTPDEWALQKRPQLAKEWIKPCFLIVRARAENPNNKSDQYCEVNND